MFRKRERFDRIDVPRETPYRNLIGVIVCVVSLAATAALVSLVWNRVSLETRLEDSGLSESIEGQSSTYVPDGGYVASTDEFVTTLLLAASSLDEEGASLGSARVLTIDRTTGTGVVGTVPLDLKMVSSTGEASVTLAELYASSGYDAVTVPVSTALNVRFDHVIVSTEDVLAELASISGIDPTAILSDGAGLLGKILTDADAASLVSLASDLAGVGVGNLSQVEFVIYPETSVDDEGATYETGFFVVSRAEVGIALGLLAFA